MNKKRLIHILDPKMASRLPSYLFQCGLATIALLVILEVEDVLLRAAIVVAIASSAFTVFVVPHSVAASSRRVIGGHIAGVLAGSIFSALLMIPAVGSATEGSRVLFDLMAALAVGLGTFLMVATNTEHPPAAGTALGLVVHGWTWSAVAFILTGAIVLSLVRIALRSKLVDLL